MRNMEKMAEHLNEIDSAWALDFAVLKAGMIEAAARIEALEKITAAALQPSPKVSNTGA